MLNQTSTSLWCIDWHLIKITVDNDDVMLLLFFTDILILISLNNPFLVRISLSEGFQTKLPIIVKN